MHGSQSLANLYLMFWNKISLNSCGSDPGSAGMTGVLSHSAILTIYTCPLYLQVETEECMSHSHEFKAHSSRRQTVPSLTHEHQDGPGYAILTSVSPIMLTKLKAWYDVRQACPEPWAQWARAPKHTASPAQAGWPELRDSNIKTLYSTPTMCTYDSHLIQVWTLYYSPA